MREAAGATIEFEKVLDLTHVVHIGCRASSALRYQRLDDDALRSGGADPSESAAQFLSKVVEETAATLV